MYTTADAKKEAYLKEVRTQYKALAPQNPKIAAMSFDQFEKVYGGTIARCSQRTVSHVSTLMIAESLLPVHIEQLYEQGVNETIGLLSTVVGGDGVESVIKRTKDSAKHVGDRFCGLVADIALYSIGDLPMLEERLRFRATELWRGLVEGLVESDDFSNVYDMLNQIERYMVIVHESMASLAPAKNKSRLSSTQVEPALANGSNIKDHIMAQTYLEGSGKRQFLPFAALFPVAVAARIRHQLSESQFRALYSIIFGILYVIGRRSEDSTVPIRFPERFRERYIELRRDIKQENARNVHDLYRRSSTLLKTPPKLQRDTEGEGDLGPDGAALAAAAKAAPVAAPAPTIAAPVTSVAAPVPVAAATAAATAIQVARARETSSVLARLASGNLAPKATSYEIKSTLRQDFVKQVIEAHLTSAPPSSKGKVFMLAPEDVTQRTLDIWAAASPAERARYVASHLIVGSADTEIKTADGKTYTLDAARGRLLTKPTKANAPSLALFMHPAVEHQLTTQQSVVIFPISAELVSPDELMKSGAEKVEANWADAAKKKAAEVNRRVKARLTRAAKKDIETVDADLVKARPDQLRKDLEGTRKLINDYNDEEKYHPTYFSETDRKMRAELIAHEEKLTRRLRQLQASEQANLVAASSMSLLGSLKVSAQMSAEEINDEIRSVEKQMDKLNVAIRSRANRTPTDAEEQQIIALSRRRRQLMNQLRNTESMAIGSAALAVGASLVISHLESMIYGVERVIARLRARPAGSLTADEEKLLAELSEERRRLLKELEEAKISEGIVEVEMSVGASVSTMTDDQLRAKWASLKTEWNQNGIDPNRPHLKSYYTAMPRQMKQVLDELVRRKLVVQEDIDLLETGCDTCGGKKKKKESSEAALTTDCGTCGGKKKKDTEDEEAEPTKSSVAWPFRSKPAVRKTELDYRMELVRDNTDKTFMLSGGNGVFIVSGKPLTTIVQLENYLRKTPSIRYGFVDAYKIVDADSSKPLTFLKNRDSGFLSVKYEGAYFQVSTANRLGTVSWFDLSTSGAIPNDVQIWPLQTSLVVSAPMPRLVALDSAVVAVNDEDDDVGDDIASILAEMTQRAVAAAAASAGK